MENLLLDANMDLRIIGESVVNYHFFAYSIFGIANVYINNKTTVVLLHITSQTLKNLTCCFLPFSLIFTFIVLFTDFGLSNVYLTEQEDGTMEQCATQCGSPAYAAPELLGHKSYGPVVDVWSM